MSRRDERGTALIEVTWLAILLMVPLVYVVLAVYDVQRHAFAATAAARAAGRAFVLAPDATAAASRACAVAALGDQRVDPRAVRVDIACQPAGSCLAPGSVVVVDVHTQVRLPLMPDVLGDGAPSIRVDAAHTVPYGSFREDRS